MRRFFIVVGTSSTFRHLHSTLSIRNRYLHHVPYTNQKLHKWHSIRNNNKKSGKSEIGKTKKMQARHFFPKKSHCPLKIVYKKVLAPQNMIVEKCCCPPFSFGKKNSGPPFSLEKKIPGPPFFVVKKSVCPPFSPIKKSHSPLFVNPARVSHKFWAVPKLNKEMKIVEKIKSKNLL